jgi:serine/threonine-protein kinase
MRYCPLCERTYGDEVNVCEIDGSVLRESGSKQDPLIGKIVRSRYRVLKKLGEGGMGSVYLAEQIAVNRNVALKILHSDYARDPEFVKRFRQEAKLAASLSHHNIVTIFDFDQADDGSLYIVMEYVAGDSLSTVIKSGHLDIRTAVRLGIQIAEGLRAAHTAGVIHRDIKPENIMVLPGDEIKLMDFGIARLSNVEGATRLTRSGMIMGTPTYMAPEQIEGGEVGVATDIYAFGVLLYEMLSGQVPFTAPTPGAVLIKHLTETAPPLRKLRNDIPASIEKVVKQALEKKPGSRQRSMDEVVELLAKAQRATAADKKSIISTMGGFFRSAFTRAVEVKRPTHEDTALQELERPLETRFEDTHLSAQQPGILPEPESPTIDTFDVRYPVAVAPPSTTVAVEDVPAPIASSAATESIGLTEGQLQNRYADAGASPVAASDTVIEPRSAATLAETIAATAMTPGRRGRAASGWYAGLSAAAVVLLTALGFLLYHRQGEEPETRRLAQGTNGSPSSPETIGVTEEILANKPVTPTQGGQELPIEPELPGTRKNTRAPQPEKKPAVDLPALPSPRPAADVKNTSKKTPEPAQVKEQLEVARLAPVPEAPSTKKIVQEQVKVTEKPKEADGDKNKKSEPVKKEPETKVASIDKPAIKQPGTSAPPPENRLLSLAIISAKKDINVKERVLLTVKGKYSDGNENEIITGVRFESSDANVAAVNSRGEVEGKKEGKAEVTARYAGVVSGVYTFYVKGGAEKEKADQAAEPLQDQRRRLLR